MPSQSTVRSARIMSIERYATKVRRTFHARPQLEIIRSLIRENRLDAPLCDNPKLELSSSKSNQITHLCSLNHLIPSVDCPHKQLLPTSPAFFPERFPARSCQCSEIDREACVITDRKSTLEVEHDHLSAPEQSRQKNFFASAILKPIWMRLHSGRIRLAGAINFGCLCVELHFQSQLENRTAVDAP